MLNGSPPMAPWASPPLSRFAVAAAFTSLVARNAVSSKPNGSFDSRASHSESCSCVRGCRRQAAGRGCRLRSWTDAWRRSRRWRIPCRMVTKSKRRRSLIRSKTRYEGGASPSSLNAQAAVSPSTSSDIAATASKMATWQGHTENAMSHPGFREDSSPINCETFLPSSRIHRARCKHVGRNVLRVSVQFVSTSFGLAVAPNSSDRRRSTEALRR
mmetsp:Transcript_48115/g.125822  ORF Transcript_48115/g.125822 Transcript_48115/m.125822 type:complete len:214 (-) Transcript_48115:59-700(-)